jgi:hypothetical protein
MSSEKYLHGADFNHEVSDSGYEKILVDTEKYHGIVMDLLKAHWEEIYEAENAFPPLQGIAEELKELPEDILKDYYGHGVTRGSVENQISSILSLIENETIIGDIGELGRSAYISAYNTGGFLVILDPDDYLAWRKKSSEERGDSRVQVVDGNGTAKFALKFKPLAVVCNSHLDSLVEPLKQMFPSTTVISAREVKNFILSHAHRNG